MRTTTVIIIYAIAGICGLAALASFLWATLWRKARRQADTRPLYITGMTNCPVSWAERD